MMGGNFKRKKMLLYHRWFEKHQYRLYMHWEYRERKKSIEHKVTRQE